MEGAKPQDVQRIRIFEGSAQHTHGTVHAEVDGMGELVVYARDVGAVPEDAASREYTLTVREAAPVLLRLLKERFGEGPDPVADLEAWLEGQGIPFTTAA